MIHLDATPEIKAMAQNAFPDYAGRKFKLNNYGSVNLASYWSGGSRDYFVVLSLDNGRALPVPQNGTMFDGPNFERFDIPPGYLVVEHSIFNGRDSGITFYVNPETSLGFLPEPINLTDAERIVLQYTASHRNTYAGESNVRYREAHRDTGIIEYDWEYAKSACVLKGLLTKGNAITNKGRNAL